MKANLSRNIIQFLRNDAGERVSDSSQLKDMIMSFYSGILGRSNEAVNSFSVEHIKQLQPFRCDATLSLQLNSIPTNEEIKAAVFSLPCNKAPGPDNFTVEFYISSWDLVGDDLIRSFKDFFVNPSMLRQVNTTVLSLIPKVT